MKKQITIYLISLVSISGFSQYEINDDNYEQYLDVKDDTLIVMDFYATWCGPCRMMEPTLEKLENTYGSVVKFYKMDVDKNVLDDALEINAVPTYILIKNGELIKVIEGMFDYEMMVKEIEEHQKSKS